MPPRSGTARLDGRGRLSLPAELRRRLDLRPGDDLVLSEEPDGALRLESRRSAAKALIGSAGSAPHSTVDELLDERGRESAAAARDARRSPR